MANHLRAGGLKKGRITCLDMGSSDDTISIIERLKQKYDHLDVFSHKLSSEEELTQWLKAEQQKEKVVVLDLRDIDEDKETA
jgi:primosomal protein N'